MNEDHRWVSGLLRAQAPATMPDDVIRRMQLTLATEQALRTAGDFEPDLEVQELEELDGVTNRGRWGGNGPAHYDKPGIGLVERELVEPES